MTYEAAIVRRNDQGKELAEAPKGFDDLDDAMAYVAGSPVSIDGNRPWIRDITKPAIGQFLMIGGKLTAEQKSAN